MTKDNLDGGNNFESVYNSLSSLVLPPFKIHAWILGAASPFRKCKECAASCFIFLENEAPMLCLFLNLIEYRTQQMTNSREGMTLRRSTTDWGFENSCAGSVFSRQPNRDYA